MEKGIATMPLDYGRCPKWLFERMVKLSREMIEIIVADYGPEEFVKRLADPVWFQSLGTVLAFDWNSSGLTTILTAALKQAIRYQEKDLGIFICGGKGKTSRKTPQEIERWAGFLSLPEEETKALTYNSKMAAKVDSSLIQDGFQIYHHAFFFTKKGVWTVVQQGMNTETQRARRYHWFSENVYDLVCQPHTGIVSDVRVPSLNLVAEESQAVRDLSTELSRGNYYALMKDVYLLAKYFPFHKTATIKKGQESLRLISLENKEFKTHPVVNENFFQSKYLKKILYRVTQIKPKSYQELLSLEGVGPKTIRALSLVSEMIYKAKPSYEDPSRYSFAHGGKDGTPYPVDRKTYDETIDFMRKVVAKTKIPPSQKRILPF